MQATVSDKIKLKNDNLSQSMFDVYHHTYRKIILASVVILLLSIIICQFFGLEFYSLVLTSLLIEDIAMAIIPSEFYKGKLKFFVFTYALLVIIATKMLFGLTASGLPLWIFIANAAQNYRIEKGIKI